MYQLTVCSVQGSLNKSGFEQKKFVFDDDVSHANIISFSHILPLHVLGRIKYLPTEKNLKYLAIL